MTHVAVFSALMILNFAAFSSMITKAGYSRRWIVIPLAPACVTLYSFVMLILRANADTTGITSFFLPGLSAYPTLQRIDGGSVVVAWVFFIAFAFARWPNSSKKPPTFVHPVSGQPLPDRRAPRDPGQVPVAYNPAGQPYARRSEDPDGDSSSPWFPKPATRLDQPAQVTQEQSPPPLIYCGWCGKGRPVDAVAIHYCGSSDRPVVYCTHCGAALNGAPSCTSCDTPAQEVSRT